MPSIEAPNTIIVLTDYERAARYVNFKDKRYNEVSGKVLTDKDGWFLLGQSDPVASRKQMPDRQRLGNLLRFINENRRPLTLEECAGLEVALPWDTETSYLYASHLRPLESNAVDSYNNRTALRIYGSMTSSQRESAKKAGIPLSRLSDEVKLELYRALFYSQRYESQVEMDYSNMGNMTPADQKEMNDLQQLLYGGMYEEKTFVFPNGLTNNFLFSIEESSSNDLYCARPEPQGEEDFYSAGQTMSAFSIGDRLFKFTNPKKYKWETQSYNKIDENNIHLASQRNITIKIKLNNMMAVRWRLNQTLLTDPTVYTMKTLPAKVLEEIKKGYEQAEKNDKNYQGFGQDQKLGNPPPL